MNPITPHRTWTILDSSKLDEYIACPRKFFFRYILGWVMDTPAHDLHFGHCWHIAREHQLIHGYEDIEGAYMKFEDEYRRMFPPESDEIYLPKTPGAVLKALIQYASEHRHDLIDHEVVEVDGVKMTEISGTVPIDDHRVLHYKMDSVIRRKSDQRILSWDHKSTGGKWFDDTRWDNEFFLSIQNGTYTHCLYCMFPIEEVLGVEFCKTGFTFLKKGSRVREAGYHIGIRYIPAFKTPEQMNIWLWNTLDLVKDVERDMDRLSECHEGDSVLCAFHMNPKSCSSYRGCPYHDYCLAWPNPLRQAQEPPLGFRTEFWDPSAQETTVKKDLEWRT